MNPYDFVPVDRDRPPQRRPYRPHNLTEGLSGRLQCRITAESPLFIPEYKGGRAQLREVKRFLTNSEGREIIPGSSLKGLFRSLVETVGPGCWLLFGRGNCSGEYRDFEERINFDYHNKLHDAFYRCNDLKSLCPACRLFGVINGRNCSYGGNVTFSDAVCVERREHDPVYTIILSAPKPRHESWYLTGEDNGNGRTVAGRKYYYHMSDIATAGEYLPRNSDKPQNQYIKPLNTGSVFEFEASFNNIDDDDLNLLLYALFLEPGLRHKLGNAKPAGLGSVLIEPLRLEIFDMDSRYRGGDWKRTLQGEPLTADIRERTSVYRDDSGPAISALRRIWQWPPLPVNFSYPGYRWFKDNPRRTMAEFNSE
jgi:CRISPR/Cas system CSM-associated protein Csm3 (group 7 of RAMP superfamily)